MAKGNISVSSENIFPIIKKWLYSDKDIFLRELVSNGCDAVTKLKKLAGIGEAKVSPDEKYRVDVIVDKENKTLTVKDNGIGMTAEEIRAELEPSRYIGRCPEQAAAMTAACRALIGADAQQAEELTL